MVASPPAHPPATRPPFHAVFCCVLHCSSLGYPRILQGIKMNYFYPGRCSSVRKPVSCAGPPPPPPSWRHERAHQLTKRLPLARMSQAQKPSSWTQNISGLSPKHMHSSLAAMWRMMMSLAQLAQHMQALAWTAWRCRLVMLQKRSFWDSSSAGMRRLLSRVMRSSW
jgi:hypothetical protein